MVAAIAPWIRTLDRRFEFQAHQLRFLYSQILHYSCHSIDKRTKISCLPIGYSVIIPGWILKRQGKRLIGVWLYLATVIIIKMSGPSTIIEYCTRSILPPCPSMGFGVVERHLEMAQPTKKPTSRQHFYSIRDQISVLDPVAHLFSNPDFFLLSQSVVFQENKVKCHHN